MFIEKFKKISFKIIVLTIVGIGFANYSFAGNDGSVPKKSQKLSKTSEYVHYNSLDINNIRVYFQNNGNIQDPKGNWAMEFPRDKNNPVETPTKTAIFAGGFALSGYVKGELRASWMASASRVEDWQPGNRDKSGKPANPDLSDFKVYKYNKTDKYSPTGTNDIAKWPVQYGAPWMDKTGAMRYGTGYDPANGDRPYLYGDQMVWYVINDGVDEANANRRFKTKGMGLEAQVNAFAFNQSNSLANGLFIIYKFINRGKDDIENAIFSVWSDPDLGNSDDDLVGVDSVRSLAYIYNEGNNDSKYGTPPPAAGYDFFLGPKVPRTKVVGGQTVPDSSYTVNILGKKYYGYEQLAMNSFVKYVRDRADLPDPNTVTEARNYQEGKKYNGAPFNPLTDGVGGKATDNPYIVHPGYPETPSGWLDSQGGDRRMMINTKQFNIAAGDTQVIVVGYMAGLGSDNKNSVAKLRQIDDVLQKVFNLNFIIAGPPPAPEEVSARVDEQGRINLSFKTSPSMKYDFDDGLTRKVFKAFRVNQYLTSSTQESIDGVVNKKEMLLIDVKDGYSPVYDKKESGSSELVFESKSSFQDRDIFLKPDAQFNLTATIDQFTGYPFIPGKTYYFGVSAIGIDIKNIAPIKNTDGETIGWASDSPIIESGETPVQIVYNGVVGNSFVVQDSSKYVSKVTGNGAGTVFVDVLDLKNLESEKEYTINFQNDGIDNLMWGITDVKKDSIIVDSLRTFSKEMFLAPVNGMSIRVKKPLPAIVSSKYKTDSKDIPLYPFSTLKGVAVLSKDATTENGLLKAKVTPSVRSSALHDNVKNVLLDFSDSSYAFRYVSGFNAGKYNPSVKVPVSVNKVVNSKTDSIGWAGYSVLLASASETTPGIFASGRWKAGRKPGVGITKVPFKAWDISTDPQNPRQLMVGFIERYIPDKDLDTLQYLDGKWNPLGKYGAVPEMLLISGETYDPSIKTAELDTTKNRSYKDFLIRNNALVAPWIIGLELNVDATSISSGKNIEINTNILSALDKYLIRSPKNHESQYESTVKNVFNKVTIYPNPYMGDNPAELTNTARFVTIGNLPQKATIRVYNLAGQLVRKIEKDSDVSLATWDLKNLNGLYVASGVYLIHIESPGLGSKVLKFALIQRQERIDTY